VVAAWEAVIELAGTTQPWPTTAVLDRARSAVRAAEARPARRHRHLAPVETADDLPGTLGRTGAEHLALALVDGLRSGAVAAGDGRALYATAVLGFQCGEVAVALGVAPATARGRRRRAQRAMTAMAA